MIAVEVGPDLTFLGEIPHLLLTPKDRPLRWNLLAGRLSLLLNRVNTDEPFDIGPYTCLPLDRVLIDAEGEEKARLTDKEAGPSRHAGRSRGGGRAACTVAGTRLGL